MKHFVLNEVMLFLVKMKLFRKRKLPSQQTTTKKKSKLNSGIAQIVDDASDTLITDEENNDINAEMEMKAYLSAKITQTERKTAIEIAKDTCIWWKDNHHNYPYVALLFRAIMAIPGSNCPSKS